jgi:hypothetical protein
MQQPVMVIADLDRVRCAPRLIDQWFGNRRKPTKFMVLRRFHFEFSFTPAEFSFTN